MSINIRPMTPADIPFGMQLKSFAGWNQVEADWEVFLKDDLQGNFVAEYEGKPVGTTTTINYERKFSWIGMVLVHPEYRGLGIGTALLNQAIAHARPYGAIGLDATADGARLYKKLGFETISTWIRMRRESGPAWSSKSKIPAAKDLTDFTPIVSYDSQIFGAARGGLLENIYNRNHQLNFSTQNGQINGYILLRQGSQALQLGPLNADREDIARELLIGIITTNAENKLFIDTFVHSQSWIDFLLSCGFEKQREFSRMYVGKSDWGQIERQFALTGPEFG